MRYLAFISFSFLIALLPVIATADPGTVPYVFSPGTPVRASEINANFTHVLGNIDNAAASSAIGIFSGVNVWIPRTAFSEFNGSPPSYPAIRLLYEWDVRLPGSGYLLIDLIGSGMTVASGYNCGAGCYYYKRINFGLILGGGVDNVAIDFPYTQDVAYSGYAMLGIDATKNFGYLMRYAQGGANKIRIWGTFACSNPEYLGGTTYCGNNGTDLLGISSSNFSVRAICFREKMN